MSEEDLKINAKVRKILVEHKLDLSSIRVITASGAVSIRGEMKKITQRAMTDRDLTNLLIVLENVILRTKGVKRVSFNIKKWERKKGKWIKSEE